MQTVPWNSIFLLINHVVNFLCLGLDQGMSCRLLRREGKCFDLRQTVRLRQKLLFNDQCMNQNLRKIVLDSF